MADEMGKENPRITFVEDKARPSPDEIRNDLNELHNLRQKIDHSISVMEERVELNVAFDGPVRIIPISDTHLFAAQTDVNKVNELLEKLNEPNTYGIIMGDFIEGAHPMISDHSGSLELNVRQQVWAAKQIIKPYVDTGKILCMVGTFSGHEGWGERLMNFDIVQEIAYGFKQLDGTDLKVVYNGGKLIVHLKNGVTYTQLLYHAPGGGGSDEINPLGAQRMRLWEYTSRKGPIDGVGGGDWHHRAGVAKELSFDFKEGKERSHILFANGTTKGNDPERPDPFLTRMAKGPTLSPGVQLVLNQPERRRDDGRNGEYVWTSYGFDKGGTLYEAAKLWDKTEKQHKTEEVVGNIIYHARKPKIEFDRDHSRTKAKESRFDTPLFEKFDWKINNSSKLPILVYLLANTRYDSTSFERRDKEKFLQIVEHVAGNPFEFVLAMRHMVDFSVARQFDRHEVLDRLIADLKPLADHGSLLGIMLSSSLMDARWEKDALGELIEVENDWPYKDGSYGTHWERERDPGFKPGDYIYRRLNKDVPLYRRVPLYLNQALMTLKHDEIGYDFLLLDHLSHSGSEFDMFRGLVQARRKSLLNPDVVAGGHMPGAGFMTTPDATYISPGWFSDYDSRGRANMRRAPLGGQGVILFSDRKNRKLIIPASTVLEATDTHSALMLLMGLDKKEREKLLYKTR